MRRKSSANIARELLDTIDSTSFYDMTFCDVNGLNREQRNAVEQHIKQRFNVWVNSWIKPGLEEIRDK